VPEPHTVQREPLGALAGTRAAGNHAGLVVLATGLGKTWLAAFDTVQAQATRVLFVARREEILDQALATFRAIRPHASLGKYTGGHRAPNADVLFASIQTLGRHAHLERFAREHFDYVIVDEFHHASAPTYPRLLDHFTPRFLLGLTATPARSDGADLLALCGESLIHACGIAEGITRGLLAPFDYFGVWTRPDLVQVSTRTTSVAAVCTARSPASPPAYAWLARESNSPGIPLRNWRWLPPRRSVHRIASKRHRSIDRGSKEHAVMSPRPHEAPAFSLYRRPATVLSRESGDHVFTPFRGSPACDFL
jgi:hypothetical protein